MDDIGAGGRLDLGGGHRVRGGLAVPHGSDEQDDGEGCRDEERDGESDGEDVAGKPTATEWMDGNGFGHGDLSSGWWFVDRNQ
jgi:hypothetical protein